MALGRTAVTAGLAALLVMGALIVLPQTAQAATIRHETDTDFLTGSQFTGTEVVGTGVPASVQILKDYPSWSQGAPASSPSARRNPAMAFDEVNGEVVLFGGYDGSYRQDTWRYNIAADAWTEIFPATPPGVREHHGMAYASNAQVIVLFGGQNSLGSINDTWEFDVNTDSWSQVITAPNPGGMVSPPLAYDSSQGRVITADTNIGGFQTWAYNPVGNTWSNRVPLANPPGRVYHTLSYDEFNGKTTVFGGTTPGFPPVIRADTWEYDWSLNSWTKTGDYDSSNPGNRTAPAGAYRSTYGDLLIFGGYSGSAYLDDTWRYHYDLVFPQWDPVIAGSFPSARDQAAMVYSVADNIAVVFGGNDLLGNLGDTWRFELTYRPGGFYRSGRLDGSTTVAVWNSFTWNLTPANQPPGSLLRFQLDIGNDPNPASFNFIGPTCSSAQYYLSTPATIDVGCNTGRYLWYFAQLVQGGPQATPVLDDITFDYTAPVVPPFIDSTSPFHTEFGVATDRAIIINFSEAMDTTSVTIESWPFVTLDPFVWTNGDSTVTASHIADPFLEASAYRVWVNGSDTGGTPLVPGPVPGCCGTPFLFVTAASPPTILFTDPFNTQIDVAIGADIVVTFSETMDTTTVNWTISPNVPLTDGWSGVDSVLTLSHSGSDFASCTWYTVEITAGMDLSGLPLSPQPGVNPWTFRSFCFEPFVVSVSPFDRQLGVAVNAPMVITWSEQMNTGSVVWDSVPPKSTYSPIVETWNSPADDVQTLNHTTDFQPCTKYTVTITDAADVGGTRLLSPYTWWFVTVCSGPFIYETHPLEGAIDVPVMQVINLNWSEEMSTPVSYTVSSGTPTTQGWSGFNRFMTITPSAPFPVCTAVTITITAAQDTSARSWVDPLNLDPLTFNTFCANPRVMSTVPADGQVNVLVTQDVIVDFDRPMRTLTTTIETWPATNFTQVWSNNNMTLTGTHAAQNFLDCTNYTAWVNGTDFFGFPLIPGPVPNPWIFRTINCGGGVPPYILATDPVDGATNVPLTQSIIVDFSEAMDVSLGAVTLVTVPPTTFGVPTWSSGDTRATWTHAAPFTQCTLYTATVTGVDLDGDSLVAGPVPNPWDFTTPCTLAAPANLKVQRSGVLNADITLVWDAVSGATSYRIYESGNRFAAFPGGWNPPVSDPASPYTFNGHGGDGQTHYYIVRAANNLTEGPNSTMGVKTELAFTLNAGPGVTNIQWFSLPYQSMYTRASTIAQELGSTRVDLIGKWDPAKQRSDTYFFSRGRWRGTDFTIGAGDGLYLGVVSSFGWVINGTDSLPVLGFTLNPPGKANVNWRGIPYTGTYATASDIMMDLEPLLGNSRIREIGKWNGATQTSTRFYYNGITWVGVDFAVNPGDGIYLIITSSFTWTPALLTPPVP